MATKNIRIFEGESVDVHWDKRLCIHIGECGQSEGHLFVGGRDPWCQPDIVDGEYVKEVVLRCPSGALSYADKAGNEAEQPEAANTVQVVYNGPLYVKGDLEIDGAGDDMEAVHCRAALCRCGQSSNKPFCDNSHDSTGFRDTAAVGEKGKGADAVGGKLHIKPLPNGPLILTGNFAILAGSGRTAWHGTQAALCRCGHSRNKPFCDGSHVDANFEAD